MAYQMNIDNMLETLINANHPAADSFKQTVEGIGTAMGACIAQSLKVDMIFPATFQGVAFAGTCAAFGPKRKGQRLPEAMIGMDTESEWGF